MTRKYFGTDGIRGRVAQPPMTPEFALKLGWAAGRVLAETSAHPLVVIGKDTRLSGYLFESALEAGFAAAGVSVAMVGPMPTPAVAYLTRTFRASAGVVISASHNAYEDNGFKFFSGDGRKLPDDVELRIEALLDQPLAMVAPEAIGKAQRIDDAAGRYVEFCKRSVALSVSLTGLKLVVDCANGAAYRVAPEVFREIGASVQTLATEPDGFNINRDCGSTHLDRLRTEVLRSGAHAGVALDGDGDRCLMVDREGRTVDGDQLLYVIARSRHERQKLRGPVVGTLMSNLGLERGLAQLGIPFERAAVGDRYVLDKLEELGGTIGGESSGHIICLDRSTTGDGIISALQVLMAMTHAGRSLAELVAPMEKYPQVLINVPVSGAAKALVQSAAVQSAIRDGEKRLAGKGRLLLRPSGTEPLVRVMVECADARESRETAEFVAARVREAADGGKARAT
ncbi:MAG TPA: phosphoglucosamine mutase [Candidatus Binatia bacterium]|nr:phosphoglucosamine mutase [Candidatus Binatia bacterium]